MTESPLKEAELSSLDELFARDPLELSKTDREAMVAEFRRMRVKWDMGEKATANKEPKAPKAAKAPKSKNDGISLNDLLGIKD